MDGDWAYCGYEGDLKSSGDRALSEEEESRGMISDDIVDDDDDEVLMQGGVGFILNHSCVVVVVAVVGGRVCGDGYLEVVITGGSRSRAEVARTHTLISCEALQIFELRPQSE